MKLESIVRNIAKEAWSPGAIVRGISFYFNGEKVRVCGWRKISWTPETKNSEWHYIEVESLDGKKIPDAFPFHLFRKIG